MSAERWMKHLEMVEKVRKQVRAKERAQVAKQEKIRQEAEKRSWLRELEQIGDELSRSFDSYSNHCKEVDKKMDESTKERLDDYLELLEKIKEKTQDERAGTVLLTEIAKDRRMQQIRQERNFSGTAPATEKQISFLKNLGAVIPEGLTRQRASRLIEDTKAAITEMKKTGNMPVRVP